MILVTYYIHYFRSILAHFRPKSEYFSGWRLIWTSNLSVYPRVSGTRACPPWWKQARSLECDWLATITKSFNGEKIRAKFWFSVEFSANQTLHSPLIHTPPLFPVWHPHLRISPHPSSQRQQIGSLFYNFPLSLSTNLPSFSHPPIISTVSPTLYPFSFSSFFFRYIVRVLACRWSHFLCIFARLGLVDTPSSTYAHTSTLPSKVRFLPIAN